MLLETHFARATSCLNPTSMLSKPNTAKKNFKFLVSHFLINSSAADT